jgi:hypothetical protein
MRPYLIRDSGWRSGENGYLTNSYLDELCATAQARLFVSYATGGADWYPDHLSFMFSQRNPARTALLTANWEPPEKLKDLLGINVIAGIIVLMPWIYFAVRQRRVGSGRHRWLQALAPLSLYGLDHGEPTFMKRSGR